MYPTFSWNNIIVRLLVSATLVFGTYNPFGGSYIHWVVNGSLDLWVIKILVGLALVACYWLVLAVTYLALGRFGVLLMLSIVIALIASLWDLGLLPLTAWTMQMVVLMGIAIFFSIGLSFSGIRYRISRQTQSSSINRPPII